MTSGVRQGCILAPALFCVAIDWILNHMTVRPSINIGCSSFSDLVYAGDTTFFLKDATDATDSLSSFIVTAPQCTTSTLGLPDLPYFTGDPVFQPLSPAYRMEAARETESPVFDYRLIQIGRVTAFDYLYILILIMIHCFGFQM